MNNLKINRDSVITRSSYNIGKYPFESAACYGMGQLIRKMTYLPSFLPLAVETDHGPSQRDEPTNSEYKSNAQIVFYHSKRLVDKYLENTSKKSMVYMSPFSFYRKRHILNLQKKEKKGTISFPSHSTDLIDSCFNIDNYIDLLKKLPEEFQPVDICLYYRDIEMGRHHKFLENGFDVFCAGHIYDENFISNFYQILINYKYSTSNIIGSYLFYSVDCNIPFFVHGNDPVQDNKLDDPNCEQGVYDPYELYSQMRVVRDLFQIQITNEPILISKEQKSFVDFELGIVNFNRFKFAYQVHRVCWLFFLKMKYLKIKKRIINIIKYFRQ